MTTYNDLKAEREQLVKRLNFLGVRSTGSERIERRIAEIDRTLSYAARQRLEGTGHITQDSHL